VILLDTNVISELIKPSPEPAVSAFLRRAVPETVFTAAVCLAEIRYGLARLPVGRRRNDLTGRVSAFFAESFTNRTLAFDSTTAAIYGELRAARETAGKPIAVEDAMIAATARAYGAVVVTRNVADFMGCGVEIVSPWVED
jgi:toxin FitB